MNDQDVLVPVELELPAWMTRQLEAAAQRIGVTKQDLIKLWLAEKIESRVLHEADE